MRSAIDSSMTYETLSFLSLCFLLISTLILNLSCALYLVPCAFIPIFETNQPSPWQEFLSYLDIPAVLFLNNPSPYSGLVNLVHKPASLHFSRVPWYRRNQ